MRLVELEVGQCSDAVVSDLLGRQFVFQAESSDSSRMRSAGTPPRASYWIALCLVLAAGIFLRLPASLFEGEYRAARLLESAPSESRFQRDRLR